MMLNEAKTLLEKAESKGIEILPYKAALFNANKAIKKKGWQEAENLITDSTSKLIAEIEAFDRWAGLKERERMETRNMISRIDWYLSQLEAHGIELRIKLLEDVKIAFDSGTDVDMKAALYKIDNMFTQPIFKPEKSWSYSIDDRILCLALIQSVIIIGTADKLICCLDAHKNILWKFRANNEVTNLCTFGNLIFAGSKDKNIYCLDLHGNLLWTYETGGPIHSMVDFNGLLVASAGNKYVYCLDTQGNLLWKYKTGGPVFTVEVMNYQLIAGSNDNHIYIITPDGSMNWKHSVDNEVISVKPMGNLIIALSASNSVYCINLKGTLEWKKSFERNITRLEVYYDKVYIGIEDNSLTCLDINGEVEWNKIVDGQALSIIGFKDLLFVGTSGNTLHCLDLLGKILWKYKTGGNVLTVRASYDSIYVQTNKKVIAYSTSVIPVFISIEKHIREGRIKFTNIYEAEQLFDLVKNSFEALESEKAGRLINKVKEIITEHRKRTRQTEKQFGVHKPNYNVIDNILETEYRENVITGINAARKTITDIQSILSTLVGKRANIESILSKQRDENTINDLIDDYREKLNRSKERGKMSVARSYAFMIVNQQRKLQMKENMINIIKGVDEQIKELSDFSKDLFENANEMPIDADLVGAFGILNNEAVHAINDANKLIGEISQMENEINEAALITELAAGSETMEIDELRADVRAEIEKELGD